MQRQIVVVLCCLATIWCWVTLWLAAGNWPDSWAQRTLLVALLSYPVTSVGPKRDIQVFICTSYSINWTVSEQSSSPSRLPWCPVGCGWHDPFVQSLSINRWKPLVPHIERPQFPHETVRCRPPSTPLCCWSSRWVYCAWLLPDQTLPHPCSDAEELGGCSLPSEVN